jgi:DNA (cytosine-5)-methyltransferase 1
MRPEDLGLRQGELGVIAGGPPCQPFSTAGQWTQTGRSGMADPRARTVVSMFELVETFLPAAVLIENVSGFLRGRNSAAAIVEQSLERINQEHGTSYHLASEVVDAGDYGVPQTRRRVVAVALRDGASFTTPAPTHRDSKLTAWDALADVSPEELPEARGKWAELLPLIPPGMNYQWLTNRAPGPELFGYRTKFWSFLLKLSPILPSWTLPASPGPSTGPFHWDNRPLAVEELARLQSFPDDWRFGGSTYRDRVRLIGNATPPVLAEVWGASLRSQLYGDPYGGSSLVRNPTTESLPSPPISATLPSHYLNLEGPKRPHPGAGLGPSPRATEESMPLGT